MIAGGAALLAGVLLLVLRRGLWACCTAQAVAAGVAAAWAGAPALGVAALAGTALAWHVRAEPAQPGGFGLGAAGTVLAAAALAALPGRPDAGVAAATALLGALLALRRSPPWGLVAMGNGLVLAAATSPLPGVAALPLLWAALVLAALRRPERA